MALAVLVLYIYSIRIRPKYQRYWKQALIFACIWLFSALIYANLEAGLLGDLKYYPTTGNVYSVKSALVYTGILSFAIGLIQGWIEVAWLRKRFESNPLWVKILAKGIFYFAFIILFLMAMAMVANSLVMERAIWDSEVVDSLMGFMGKFTFWSIIIYIAATLILALIFSEIVEYFGMSLLFDFIRGKYHKPNEERRIFMFLDMKSSTTIAEKIGHQKYFELIKKYYSDMTEPILETSGDIYQYVGDEIVVTWIEKKGVARNNCIECFRRISESIQNQKEQYMASFGFVPEFKAGFHVGEVTSGEIGIIKKDIIYTGDVLNTTARIQGECNKYDAQMLLSEDLYEKLPLGDSIEGTAIGALHLRGKSEPTKLYSLTF